MTRLAAVTPQAYTNKYWQKFNSYEFALTENLVPLVAAEISKAMQTIPLAFIRQGENFLLVGVLSLLPGQNMYVSREGKWLGDYVPAFFRSYPFMLARAEDREGLIMCVDEDSSLISDVEGEPLFDENGGLSKPLQGVMDFMVQVQKSKEVVDRAVAVMAAADLIVEWPLRVRIGEEEKPITGLYMVDEAKLNGLEDQLFLGLRKSQSLPVAYAQLLSMANINVLARLAGIREKAPSSAPTMELQLGDDDLIKFT